MHLLGVDNYLEIEQGQEARRLMRGPGLRGEHRPQLGKAPAAPDRVRARVIRRSEPGPGVEGSKLSLHSLSLAKWLQPGPSRALGLRFLLQTLGRAPQAPAGLLDVLK